MPALMRRWLLNAAGECLKVDDTMTYGLTGRQAEVYEFVRAASENGVPPSFEEIGIAVGIRSKSQVHAVMTALKERGHIDWIPNRARSLIVREPVTNDTNRQVEAETLLARWHERGWLARHPDVEMLRDLMRLL